MSVSTSPSPRTSAAALPIGGIMPFSASDWPGRLVLTVFTQGCPLRCSYCHNPCLQSFGKTGHSWEQALELLAERHGFLDGMVISGGEPLSSPALPAAIAAVHAADFEVGLHTSGYSPQRLAALLEDCHTRPDWIGFDVKGLSRHVPDLVGCSRTIARRMSESLDLVVHAAKCHGMGLQLRTTLWPGSPIEENLPELEELVRSLGHKLVLQWARDCDESGRYHGPGLVGAAPSSGT